jgi:hypothetical protein
LEIKTKKSNNKQCGVSMWEQQLNVIIIFWRFRLTGITIIIMISNSRFVKYLKLNYKIIILARAKTVIAFVGLQYFLTYGGCRISVPDRLIGYLLVLWSGLIVVISFFTAIKFTAP